MIEMSVVMPLYRAKFIGWLAFESLIRQKGIDFEWELIIMQEKNDEAMAYTTIANYIDGLREKGCVKVVFQSLKDWIPLATKIVQLTNLCSPDSRIWTHVIADYYSPPLRLKTCYDAFKESIDWYRTSKLLHYDIRTEELVVRRVSERGASCKAVRMELAKQVEVSKLRKGIDGWFHRACSRINRRPLVEFIDCTDNWKYGFNTHGFHNLTIERGEKIKHKTHKFLPCDVDLVSTIPPEILIRLRQARGDLGKHVIDVPSI